MLVHFEHVCRFPCVCPATFAAGETSKSLCGFSFNFCIMWLVVKHGPEPVDSKRVEVEQMPLVAPLENGMFTGPV